MCVYISRALSTVHVDHQHASPPFLSRILISPGHTEIFPAFASHPVLSKIALSLDASPTLHAQGS